MATCVSNSIMGVIDPDAEIRVTVKKDGTATGSELIIGVGGYHENSVTIWGLSRAHLAKIERAISSYLRDCAGAIGRQGDFVEAGEFDAGAIGVAYLCPYCWHYTQMPANYCERCGKPVKKEVAS